MGISEVKVRLCNGVLAEKLILDLAVICGLSVRASYQLQLEDRREMGPISCAFPVQPKPVFKLIQTQNNK